ncbi:MAG TPA: ATPase V [Spirochaetales bacterium]|nr:ATPase V [Spirochaetales bacterium]
MIFTASMKQLIAVVLDRDSDKVTRELLSQSVLHFISIKEITGGWSSQVEEATPRVSVAMITETRKRIESLLQMNDAGSPLPRIQLDIDKLKALDIEESNKELDKIAGTLQSIRDRQKQRQQEILKLEEIKRQLDMFQNVDAMYTAHTPYSFINIQTGMVPASRYESFNSAINKLPSVLLNFPEKDHQVNLLLITMKRDDSQVNKILDQFGWVDIEFSKEFSGSKKEIITDLEARLMKLEKEQQSLNNEVQELINSHRPGLESMWANLRLNELFFKIQSYFSKTSRTLLFSGWLPAEKQKALEKSIRKITGNNCYLEWNDPAEITAEKKKDIPVQFKNPRVLAPFQMLVQNYSIPQYGTIDPTPLVAVAYLIMFGLMFNDAGHGVVLALIGTLSQILYKGGKAGTRNLLKLITWCGFSAIISGILFGAYFGMGWFKPLWFDFHGIISGHAPPGGLVHDVYGILVITIYFGITIIALGLVINWINLFNKRSWLKLLLDKGGLLGGWMYGAGIYTAFYFVAHDYRRLPESALLFWLLGLPALIIFFKGPLELLLHREQGRSKRFDIFTLINLFMEWIVALLEVFSGYLANTLSFMRVAGLGIAHVSLMMAFFEISRMVSPEGGSIGSYLVLFSGNVLVIGLEGLSAGIQSLRLNYYEFFSKYFIGAGRAYMPISLRRNE